MTTDPQAAALWTWYCDQDFCHCSVAMGGPGGCATCDAEVAALAALILAEREAERAACEQIARDEQEDNRERSIDGHDAALNIADAIAARKTP